MQTRMPHRRHTMTTVRLACIEPVLPESRPLILPEPTSWMAFGECETLQKELCGRSSSCEFISESRLANAPQLYLTDRFGPSSPSRLSNLNPDRELRWSNE